MPENCDKIFVPRCNEEIWNGENILSSHLRGQDTILQKITMQITIATSAIINVNDLILKMILDDKELVQMHISSSL